MYRRESRIHLNQLYFLKCQTQTAYFVFYSQTSVSEWDLLQTEIWFDKGKAYLASRCWLDIKVSRLVQSASALFVPLKRFSEKWWEVKPDPKLWPSLLLEQLQLVFSLFERLQPLFTLWLDSFLSVYSRVLSCGFKRLQVNVSAWKQQEHECQQPSRDKTILGLGKRPWPGTK